MSALDRPSATHRAISSSRWVSCVSASRASRCVKNIGDEAQLFDGSSQNLLDTKGRTHSADSEAAIYLDESNSFLNEINPGNKVDGVVVFDIPKDATPATLELHDSMFSGGVQVAVK